MEFLGKCLHQAADKKTVILMDEYDVPLENAYFRGFYEEMADFIRSLLTYWINTRSNDIIKNLAARADREMKGKMEMLLGGGTLDIQVHEGSTTCG